MLRQQAREGNPLKTVLTGAEGTLSIEQSRNASEQIRLTAHLLDREYKRIDWWLPLLFLSWIFVITTAVLLPVIIESTDRGLLYILILFLTSTVLPLFIVLRIRPSARWEKEVLTLVERSKQVPAEESIRPLLYVAYLHSLHFFMDRHSAAPKLYDQLAQALNRLTEFTPDSQEHLFLQEVVLTSRWYPEPLRVAALLTLGDHPERSDKLFWTELKARMEKEQSEAFIAAARDVLSRANLP